MCAKQIHANAVFNPKSTEEAFCNLQTSGISADTIPQNAKHHHPLFELVNGVASHLNLQLDTKFLPV
jgi:hypothetical protein